MLLPFENSLFFKSVRNIDDIGLSINQTRGNSTSVAISIISTNNSPATF